MDELGADRWWDGGEALHEGRLHLVERHSATLAVGTDAGHGPERPKASRSRRSGGWLNRAQTATPSVRKGRRDPSDEADGASMEVARCCRIEQAILTGDSRMPSHQCSIRHRYNVAATRSSPSYLLLRSEPSSPPRRGNRRLARSSAYSLSVSLARCLAASTLSAVLNPQMLVRFG